MAEQPEPRAQQQAVPPIWLLLADFAAEPLRIGEDAAEKALLLLIGLELDRAGLAESLVEIDVLLLTERLDVKLERLTQALTA